MINNTDLNTDSLEEALTIVNTFDQPKKYDKLKKHLTDTIALVCAFVSCNGDGTPDPSILIKAMVELDRTIDECDGFIEECGGLDEKLTHATLCLASFKIDAYAYLDSYSEDARYKLFINSMKEASKLLSDAGFTLSLFPDSDTKTTMSRYIFDALTTANMAIYEKDKVLLNSNIYIGLRDSNDARNLIVDYCILSNNGSHAINTYLYYAGEQLIRASYAINIDDRKHYRKVNGKYKLV